MLDVAYVPGVHMNLFLFQAVTFKYPATPDAQGAHMLDGQLPFMRRDAGSYVDVTRIVGTPISALALAPGKMRRVDINDVISFVCLVV